MKLKQLWDRLLDVRELTLWHPESPGMKSRVRRNRFQRWIYNKEFASIYEKTL